MSLFVGDTHTPDLFDRADVDQLLDRCGSHLLSRREPRPLEPRNFLAQAEGVGAFFGERQGGCPEGVIDASELQRGCGVVWDDPGFGDTCAGSHAPQAVAVRHSRRDLASSRPVRTVDT